MRLTKSSFKILILIFLLTPQVSAQRAPRVVHKTSDELLKRIIKWQEPVFPPIARQTRAGGAVVVDLIINEKGDVVSAQVVSGHPLLRAVMLQAARQWKFRPATVNKAPVHLGGRITYEFPSSEDLFKGKTLDELEKQTREKPGSAEARYELGVAYTKLKRYDEAVTQFTEAIRIDPRSADTHLKLGHLYLRLGHVYSRQNSHQKALEAFAEATRLNPTSSEAFQALGLANVALGKIEEAIEAFKSSLQAEDPITTSYFLLGKCYVLLNRAGEAVEFYKRGLSKYPDSNMGHYGLGEAYFTLEQYEDAISEIKQAIQLSEGPGSSVAHYHLGVSYLRSGNKARALKEYDILKRLDAELASRLLNEIKQSSRRSGIS